MRFASLGSGSRGNALIVECGSTRLMLDCGFGPRETEARLQRLGLAPADLAGIVITHEHSDHIAGAFKFALRHNLRVWMTHGTWAAAPYGRGQMPKIEIIDSHQVFAVGAVEVRPFPVPHDAREPTQFVFSDGCYHLGVLTDVGCSTPHIEQMLSGCDALVLECNHDLSLLQSGNYPPQLKKRIGGRYGHLDNESAAKLLAALDVSRLKHIVAAHLSEENNTVDLARTALASVLNCEREWVAVASQDEGFAWRALS